MKLELQQLHFDNKTLFLIINESKNIIECLGKSYDTFDQFLKDFPTIVHLSHAKTLATLSNFMGGGMTYTLIEDIPVLKKRYAERVALENAGRAGADLLITQYGIYDLSSICQPCLANGVLTYYVENVNFGIPYQVIHRLPFNGNASQWHYNPLPHLGFSDR